MNESRTEKQMTILGIVGSLRRDSYNRAALREAQKLVPDDAKLKSSSWMGLRVSTRMKRRIHR